MDIVPNNFLLFSGPAIVWVLARFHIESYCKQVSQYWVLWWENVSNCSKYDVFSIFTIKTKSAVKDSYTEWFIILHIWHIGAPQCVVVHQCALMHNISLTLPIMTKILKEHSQLIRSSSGAIISRQTLLFVTYST